MPGYTYYDDDGNKQYSEIDIAVLDKAQAEKMGHVRWIDEADPVTALRAMVAAIGQPGINYAIWPQASQALSRKGNLLQAWDAMSQLNRVPIYSADTDMREFQQELGRHFSRASGLAKDEASLAAVDEVRGIVSQRVSLIARALNPDRIINDIRFNTCRKHDIFGPYAHTDGPDGDSITFRLIEPMGGKTTHIFNNCDALGVEGTQKYNLLREGNKVTAYAMPDGAMALLTAEGHACQPILHGEPWGEENERRAVGIYTVRLRQSYISNSAHKPA